MRTGDSIVAVQRRTGGRVGQRISEARDDEVERSFYNQAPHASRRRPIGRSRPLGPCRPFARRPQRSRAEPRRCDRSDSRARRRTEPRDPLAAAERDSAPPAACGTRSSCSRATPTTVTREAARQHGARVVEQIEPGYGGALVTGFALASGNYLLTMDADLSHPPEFVEQLWRQRDEADVTIASRYVAGGRADMGFYRYALSRVLNAAVLARAGRADPGPVERVPPLPERRDPRAAHHQPGFRRAAADRRAGVRRGLARARGAVQVPAPRAWQLERARRPRRHGLPAHVRSALAAAKLDPRRRLRRPRARQPHLPPALLAALAPSPRHGAHRRRGPRARHRLRLEPDHRGRFLRERRGRHSPSQAALRAALRADRSCAASGFALPFPDASFPCVLCSQVIEHVPKESPILDELCRVLAPGGRLVLGTPDYANWQWVYIEKLYGLVPGRLQGRAHLALHQSRARAASWARAASIRGRALHPARAS